jgi:hypothetical protein
MQHVTLHGPHHHCRCNSLALSSGTSWPSRGRSRVGCVLRQDPGSRAWWQPQAKGPTRPPTLALVELPGDSYIYSVTSRRSLVKLRPSEYDSDCHSVVDLSESRLSRQGFRTTNPFRGIHAWFQQPTLPASHRHPRERGWFQQRPPTPYLRGLPGDWSGENLSGGHDP